MSKYELVGIMNFFDTVPDFVVPIFKKCGELYFQEGDEKTHKISRFSKVKKPAESRVVLLDSIENNLKEKRELDLTSEPIFAFQISYSKAFLGTYTEMRKFLKGFHTLNRELEAEIKDFLDSWQY